MKKEVILFLCMLFCCEVYSMAGVSPGSYEVNFEPNLTKNVSFDFIFDEGTVSTLSVNGDLSKYVFLDRKEINGRDQVIAMIFLPSYIEEPGEHIVRVVAKSSSIGAGIGMSAEATGIIKIIVPYPGKYAETKLTLSDFDIGEKNGQKLKVMNRGNESLEIAPQVQIFLGEERTETIKLSNLILAPFEMREYSFSLNPVETGEYWAVAFVDYGNEELARDEAYFNVGNYSFKILNYSKNVGKGNFENLKILIQSQSVHEIKKVFAEVKFDGKSFASNSYDFSGLETKTFEIYLDTAKNSGKLPLKVYIYFEDKVVFQEIYLTVKHSLNLIYIIVAFILIILILIILRRRGKFLY